MTRPNPLFLSLTSVAVALLAFVAGCGGGGGDETNGQVGELTNPGEVASATPWQQPPEVVILDPNAITPLAGSPTATPAAGEAGVCGPKYTIVSGDTFSSIAEKCGTSTQAMRDANPGVDPLLIHPGDVINVPAVEPSP